MEFLTPLEKRHKTQRLFLGYFGMGIIVALGTTLLLLKAKGYEIDPQTQTVTQSGLLFVDSTPQNSEMRVTGKPETYTTQARLVLPASQYEVTVTRPDYMPWTQRFQLDSSTVRYYTYPLLLPTNPETQNVKTFSQKPALVSFSPDRRWLVIRETQTSTSFLLLDTNKTTNDFQLIPLQTGSTSPTLPVFGQCSNVQWMADNKHFDVACEVTQKDSAPTLQHLLFDRQARTATQLGQGLDLVKNAETIRSVDFIGRKTDLVVLRTSKNMLSSYIANYKRGDVVEVSASPLAVFESEKNWLDVKIVSGSECEISAQKDDARFVIAKVKCDDKNVPFIKKAEYESKWRYAVVVPKDKTVLVYDNLFSILPNQTSSPVSDLARPRKIFSYRSANTVEFSGNGRYIVLAGAGSYDALDLELNQVSTINGPSPALNALYAGLVDDHHLSFIDADGDFYISDVDGSNVRRFLGGRARLPSAINRRGDQLLDWTAQANGEFSLERTLLLNPDDR
jgi:hypothetical protein